MSLQPTWTEEIPEDTLKLGHKLLDEDDVYRLVGDEVQEVLKPEEFAEMDSPLGRGAIHPIVLALVTVLQFLENLPDRVAARKARLSVDWKYALHVPMDWDGFHYSTLSHFRDRLLEHGLEWLVFGRVLAWIRGHGFLKKHGKQRSDSTRVLGWVARLSRLELAWETLRSALRAMHKAAPRWYEQAIPTVLHDAYYQRQSDWRLNGDEVAAATQQAATDGYWLLERIEQDGPEVVRQLKEVHTLHQVFTQQFELQEN